MTNEPIKSRRGYYYNLNESPYEYESPYGDLFKFPSEKQREIYSRNVQKEVERMEKALDRAGCKAVLHRTTLFAVYRSVYRGVYKRMRF